MLNTTKGGVILGNKVAERRKELGISQVALARRTGVSRSTIYTIERNETCPSVYVAKKIATALMTDVDNIFFEDGA
jgi:putative transcriptional regulator